MIFENLSKSAEQGELILVNGGICRWHLRRDGQITIYEILVLPDERNNGIGSMMLNMLKRVPSAISIYAKCPRDLPSNSWYKRMGFVLEGTETTKSGRVLNLWRLRL